MSNFFTMEQERDALRLALNRETALTNSLIRERDEARARLRDLIEVSVVGVAANADALRTLVACAVRWNKEYNTPHSQHLTDAEYQLSEAVEGLSGETEVAP